MQICTPLNTICTSADTLSLNKLQLSCRCADILKKIKEEAQKFNEAIQDGKNSEAQKAQDEVVKLQGELKTKENLQKIQIFSLIILTEYRFQSQNNVFK